MKLEKYTVVEVKTEVFEEIDKLSKKYDLKKRRLVSDLLSIGLKKYNPEVVYNLN